MKAWCCTLAEGAAGEKMEAKKAMKKQHSSVYVDS